MQKTQGAVRTGGTGIISDNAETVVALGLTAGSDAATADFYDGQGGTLLWSLGVDAAKGYSGQAFPSDLRFETGIYVVTTGTSPKVSVAVRRPKAA